MPDENRKPDRENIDLTPLYDVAGGDEVIVSSLLNTIAKSLREHAPLLEKAFEAGDRAALRQHAHKLKSSVAYLYHDPLDAALDELETAEETGLSEEALADAYREAVKLAEQAQSVVEIKVSMMSRKPFGSE